MTCSKAQGMIMRFINNQLNLEETSEFVDHVSSCPECREELEVYYALLTAMRQLDEDKTLTSDFKQELNEKLEQAKDRVVHAKYAYYRKKVVLFMSILVLTFLVSMSYAVKDEEKHAATRSEFRIRVPFDDRKPSEAELLLQDYIKDNPLTPAPTLFP